MINFDFECISGHRFEGTFSDYESFAMQQDKNMILCPLCETDSVKRIYTGCSIQARGKKEDGISDGEESLFRKISRLNEYVKENFEYVGDDFAETARAMHYGIEKEKGIYGEAEPSELKELVEEGIKIFPVIEVDKIEN